MALHKFTPGGCRSNCDSVDECCHPTVCQAGSPATEYTVAIYKSGVLQCSWTLDQHVVATHPTAGYVCYWYASAGQAATICGTAATYYAVLNFYTGGGLTGCGIAIRTTNYPSTTGTALSGQSGSLGASPADCGVSFSGSLTNFDPSCTETWTYQVTAGATPCSTTGTTAGSGGSCCPCEDCQLFRDYFNRAAGTDLGSNWTEAAGQWTLESPSRLATDDTSAIVLSTTTSSAVGIAVTAKGASGDKVRLIAGYQDANNYFYAEFTWGTGTIDLYKRSGGSDTLLQTGTGTLLNGTFARISLCLDGSGNVRAAGGAIVVAASSTAPTGSQYGLGTGATNSGSVQFTVAESYVVSATCEACPVIIEHVGCNPPFNNCCQQEDEAYQYEVDLGAGGYVNDNCNNCAAVSGVFVLTRVGSDCAWRYEDDAFCPQTCSSGSPSSNWSLLITLQRGGPDNCRWRLSVLIYVPFGPQETCGNRLTTYIESTEPGVSATCAGTWTLPWSFSTSPGVTPCTGNLPATIGLASV